MAETTRRLDLPIALRMLRDDPLTAFAVALLVLLILAGTIGPLLPIGDPTAIGAGPRLAAPSLDFPLGTDELGRSGLPRVVGGILITFQVAAVAVLFTALLGVTIGLVAAYFGDKVDMIVARLADVLYAFPAIILGLMIASILGPGNLSVVAVIVAATLPLFIRVVRSVALSVASRDFVTAAEVAGASPLRIMFVHLLPNIAGAVIVQLTYALSIGMLIESGLSFLGLGTQPPYPSLGSLLQLGAAYLTIAPWLVFPPGIILALAILSVNLLGDGLRDALDPLGGRSIK
jgi:peptide/nickel transport system permease protein